MLQNLVTIVGNQNTAAAILKATNPAEIAGCLKAPRLNNNAKAAIWLNAASCSQYLKTLDNSGKVLISSGPGSVAQFVSVNDAKQSMMVI